MSVLGPGRLFGADDLYGQAVAKHPGFPHPAILLRECVLRGTSRTELAREVLGEDGLRMNRFRDVTRDDLVTCVSWALEDGFDPGLGWSCRWDDFARPRPYLRSLDSTRDWARKHGMTMPQLFEAARRRLAVTQ